MVQESDILEISPPVGLKKFFNGKPPKLLCSGKQALLNGKLLAIVSAREMDPDLAAKSRELLAQLASLKEVSFISGWHSPLENEALQILARNAAPIIFCLAKSLQRFIPPPEIENRVKQGQVLLLTHCGPKAKRISREASLRRNQLVVEMARAVLVLSAPQGSASLKLARSALEHDKPVLAVNRPMNKELLGSGTVTATVENLQTALQYERFR